MSEQYRLIEYNEDGDEESTSLETLGDSDAELQEELLALGAVPTDGLSHHEISVSGATMVRDNTSDWWVFTVVTVRLRGRRWPLSVQWIRETEPPWRRGFGLGVYYWRKRMKVFGVWWKGRDPEPQMPDLDEMSGTGFVLPKDLT